MPSKNRKRKRKQKIEQKPLWQFEIFFDDITMSETDGVYDEVKKLVEEEYGSHSWTIKTRMTIISGFGRGDMILDFKKDKSVWIINYATSSNSEFYNPDISCLMQWCQINGWNIPQPVESLIQSNVRMWKRMWETLLVDSDYLDKRFGERSSLRQIVEVPEDYGDFEEEL